MAKSSIIKSGENFIEGIIFASRWLQMPVYLGLIVGTGIYVYKFFEELVLLANNVFMHSDPTKHFGDVDVMLAILGLIDISMVMNLLIIVIIGGYSIFTSRIDFTEHEDRPHWLDHMDAGILKIKLATSLASISGVHLLRTFIDIHNEIGGEKSLDPSTQQAAFNGVIIEIVIHLVFIISALMLAFVERILHESHFAAHRLEQEKHNDSHHGGIPHSEIAH